MLKLMTTTNLIDPFLHKNPGVQPFNTYKRGSTRIDAVLCSPIILPSIRTLGYAPFNWVTNSDHRAIILDLKVIMSTMKTLSIRISTSWLSRYGAPLGYHGIYVAILRYVLPQCHFPSTTLRKAEKQSMPSLYAKCGFSWKTPQALLFAPLEYGGGGFVHWDVLQGEGQIMHFIKHWRTNSTISLTLRINLSWCQWQAGISTSILQYTDPDKLTYLEARWLPSLRKALNHFGAKLQVDDDYVPRQDREHDQYTMDIAATLPNSDDTHLRILNYCRLYLHVTTISEMLDATGENVFLTY